MRCPNASMSTEEAERPGDQEAPLKAGGTSAGDAVDGGRSQPADSLPPSSLGRAREIASTTSRVLTLELIQGLKVTDAAALDASQVDRSRLARRATDVFMKMI